MYHVDDKDTVVELAGVPQSSVGAPLPSVLATENQVFLVYLMQNAPEDWDGSEVRMVGPETAEEPLAIVTFEGCHAHFLGPPNDEAFQGHPLSGRGLHPYGAFKVEHSSWIRSLERMNAVHPYHSAEAFTSYSHFVFAFHDSTFECVAKGFQVDTATSSIRQTLRRLSERIE